MTAVVGILNKKAAAIAADSAVSGGGKILNRALKIFTLSKFHPVGIAIYNSDSYMGIPWELIIKMYRKQLGEENFETVEEFSGNFFNYLKSTQFFINLEHQKIYLKYNFFNKVITDTLNGAKLKQNLNPEEQIETLIESEFDNYLHIWENAATFTPEFINLTFDRFKEIFSDVLNDIVTELLVNNNINLSDVAIEKYKKLLFLITKKWDDYTYHTGLVFIGYGNSEIFPSLISCKIHFAIENNIKYFRLNDSVQITNNMGGAIRPFAQTETMNTILKGIAPNLEETCIENFKFYVEKYNQKLFDIINPINPEIAKSIQAIDIAAQTEEFRNKINEVKRAKYIDPLMDAVGTLSKEDLAEMAESLIYLTFLQKRITFAQEDVGGEVDVAIISKGDGFIWIKRKHYFKKELNEHFFDNYYNP